MTALKRILDSRQFETTITVLIVINAITLGLETSATVREAMGPALQAIDSLIISIFVVEIGLRIIVDRGVFFRDPWRLFDLLVVGFALLPSTGNLSVLRALRILRVLRLVSMVPSLRRVVGGFIAALPGMASIALLLLLVFYVFSVMATNLYGETFPERFGNLGASAYTLFQVMTLEGWSDGVVRPIMEKHPMAWVFFIPFIVVTAFAVLNLFIGVIVSAMQEEHEAANEAEMQAIQDDQNVILDEIRALREEVRALRQDRIPG